jgi:hypothetical protein
MFANGKWESGEKLLEGSGLYKKLKKQGIAAAG